MKRVLVHRVTLERARFGMETSVDKSEQKRQTRRSPRNHSAPSAALLAAKRNMKQRARSDKGSDLIKDDYDVAQSVKNVVRGKTGIVYDDLMVTHYCLWDSSYPECPERYSSVMNRYVGQYLIKTR